MSNKSKIPTDSGKSFPSPRLSSRLSRNKAREKSVNSCKRSVLKEQSNYEKPPKAYGKEPLTPQSPRRKEVQSAFCMNSTGDTNEKTALVNTSVSLEVNGKNQKCLHPDLNVVHNPGKGKMEECLLQVCEQDEHLVEDIGKDKNIEVNTVANSDFGQARNSDKECKSDTDDEQDSDLSSLGLLSQDNCPDSSQDGGYYCEVRWASHSPETIRRLKKLRGQYSIESVKEIVANFSDAHVKPRVPSYSFGTFLPKNELIDAKEMKLRKAKERAAKKRPKRFQSREAVQEMINMLQERASKQKGDIQKESSNSSKGSETCDQGNLETSIKCSSNCDLKASDKTGAKSSAGCNMDDDSCWSDEDLFKDNSFLIEATQNPEKFLNTSHDLSVVTMRSGDNQTSSQTGTGGATGGKTSACCASKTLKDSSLLLDDSGIVASSCGPRQPLLKNFSSLSSSKPNWPSCSTSTAAKSFHKPFTFVKTVTCSSNINTSISTNTAQNSSVGLRNPPHTNSSVKPVQSYFRSANSYKSSENKSLQPNRNSSCQSSNSFGAKSSNAFSVKCAASVNKFVYQNKNKQHKAQSCVEKSTLSSTVTVKPTFRKFNSFQVDNKSESKSQSPNTSLNSSFKRTLSFDSLNSPNRSSTPTTGLHSVDSNNFAVSNYTHPSSVKSRSVHSYHNPNPVVMKSEGSRNFQPLLNEQKSKPRTSVNNNKQQSSLNSEIVTNKVSQGGNVVVHPQNDGFDVSLPEDILQQLLELDEVLDSQAVIISSASSKASHRQFSPANSYSTTTKQLAQSSATLPSRPFKNQNLHVTSETRKTDAVFDSSIRPDQVMKSTGALLSPVKPVSEDQPVLQSNMGLITHNFYKKTFSLQKMGSPHPLRILKHRQSFGPSSSTPVKHAKSNDSDSPRLAATGDMKGQTSSDSFLESAFDDSFMNDAVLFESQILPILEKAELEALKTTTPITAPLGSPVRCSPEEIEQKRQAAILRRSLRLTQMKKTDVP